MFAVLSSVNTRMIAREYYPLLWFAIGGICVSLVSLIVWIKTNEGNDGFAVGFITAVEEQTLTVADRYDAHTKVVVSDSTTILKGSESAEFTVLSIGEFIQVSGTPVDPSTIAAEQIRLLAPPPRR